MTKSAPTMIGLELPDVDRWSDRVIVVLGQNPGPFTGPGTNSYLIGTGSHRILLDPGEGKERYLPVLESALERAGCEGIQEIVVTHAHHDHMGGVASVLRRFGPLKVSKRPWPGTDEIVFRHALCDDRSSPRPGSGSLFSLGYAANGRRGTAHHGRRFEL